MKTQTGSSVGSLHPILFFALLYAVALFLSVLICSAVFRKISGSQVTGNAPARYEARDASAIPANVALLR